MGVFRRVQHGAAALRILSIAIATLWLVCAAAAAEAEDGALVPRLVLTPKVIERIQTDAKNDPEIAQAVKALLERAERTLNEPTLVEVFKTKDGGELAKLPSIGHKSVERLTELSLAWQLGGDRRYAERGREELLALAGLETWFPEHFLGATRIALGVALGYDWLAGALDAKDREIVRTALLEKAIKPGLAIFNGDVQGPLGGWTSPKPSATLSQGNGAGGTVPDGTATADELWPVATFNWNLACNTGLALAALAVQPEEGEIAEKTLRFVVRSVRSGFSEYEPDGAWPEGPMYWALATRDAAILIDALESATGDSYGLSDAPSLSDTGDYFLHVMGPTKLLFNYGDSFTQTGRTAMDWLAQRYDRSLYAWFAGEPAQHSLLALDLIWRRTKGRDPVATHEPKVRWFGGYDLVTMRSDWLDPSALFVGFKAGDSRSHHDHLDLGTFVLDGQGVRWAIDLGPGNYGLPGYFAKERFQYYRTATIGQNTLMFGGQNQKDDVRAEIIDFDRSPDFTYAVADLSEAYDAPAGAVQRGIAMIRESRLLVQDEISNDRPDEVLWTMHTQADVTLDGATALLEQDGKHLAAVILSPDGAAFETRTADPCKTAYNAYCEQQNPNKGIKRLVVELPATTATKPRRLAILLVPGARARPDNPPDVIPMADWRGGYAFGEADLGGGDTAPQQ